MSGHSHRSFYLTCVCACAHKIEFQKRHLKTSEKTARKNAALDRQADAQAHAQGDDSSTLESQPLSSLVSIDTTPHAGPSRPSTAAKEKPKPKKYTPFPPAMPPSKVDLQLASGEYFLKPKEKEAIERQKREDRQAGRAAEKRAEREEAFVAPEERREEGVKERRKRKRDKEAGVGAGAGAEGLE